MKNPIRNIRLWTASRDVPNTDGKLTNYGLVFVADNEALAKEICTIHGLTYDGECVSIIDDNNGGELTTLYDKDGDDTTSFDKPKEPT